MRGRVDLKNINQYNNREVEEVVLLQTLPQY